jgi:hypothetical protein
MQVPKANLRKMESALTLPDRDAQLLTQNIDGTVVGHLEVVDAGHDGRQIVVGRVWWFAWLANDGEHGRKVLEAWNTISTHVDVLVKNQRTSNGQLRTTSDELQEIPSLLICELAHSLE